MWGILMILDTIRLDGEHVKDVFTTHNCDALMLCKAGIN